MYSLCMLIPFVSYMRKDLSESFVASELQGDTLMRKLVGRVEGYPFNSTRVVDARSEC